MLNLFIPVLLGTAREGRRSEAVARAVSEALRKQTKVETELVDVRDHLYTATTPPWGKGGAKEKPTKWQETVKRADGFVMVVPEYNRGYPGELKLLLDSLFEDYFKKPVTVCGVSSGGFGGARVIEHIKPVLIELGMVPMRKSIHTSKTKELFDEKGKLLDKGFIERLKEPFEELIWYANALKMAREK